MYQRALVLSKQMPDVNLETVLTVTITDVPPTLFRDAGTRRRPSNKSDLLLVLEEKVTEDVIQDRNWTGISICIIDAMADIHSLNTNYMKTFKDIG